MMMTYADLPMARRMKKRPYQVTNSQGRQYYLHARIIELRNGHQRAIFYFARRPNFEYALAKIPRGWIVGFGANNELPHLAKGNPDQSAAPALRDR